MAEGTGNRAIEMEKQSLMSSNMSGATTAPQVTVVEAYDEMSRLAADVVQSTIESAPGSAMTLPTGDTPRGMFDELVRRIDAGVVDFSQVHLFSLDDYLGVSIDDEASLTRWLRDAFLIPGDIPEEKLHLIPADADDPHAAAERYEGDLLALGGLELAIVGLGPNGHIAFNEPGSEPDSRTRVVDLTPESREQNAAYYTGDQDIPSQAITMGLGTILSARRIVLIVSGEGKAEILSRSLHGPMTSDVPASWLRLAESRLEIIADRAAAAQLTLT